jgi:5'-3' exonuclease
MLTGDVSDNIPGLAKVGPVKAAKTLQDCVSYDDMAKAAWGLYKEKEQSIEYFKEQGQLLWLQRYEGELWEPPKDLLESS